MNNGKNNRNDFLIDIILNKCLMFKTNLDKYNSDHTDENLLKEIKFLNTETNYLFYEKNSEELTLKEKVEFSYDNNFINKNRLECIKFTNNIIQKYNNELNKISNLSNYDLVDYFKKANQLNQIISKDNSLKGLNLSPFNFGYNLMVLDAYDCMTKEKYNLNALDNTFKDFKKNYGK